MKKILGSFLILWSLTVEAGLPPTTLSGQSQATKPTTLSFKTPYNQTTQISGVESLIETGSGNILVNPGFEGSNTGGVGNGWSTTGTTIGSGSWSISTSTGEVIDGKRAQKLTLSSTTMALSQSVTIASGVAKMQYVVGIAYLATGVTNFSICSLVDGAEQTCVPTANLIVDNLPHMIEIPTVVTGTTSVGIKIKTDSSTGTVIVDNAYIKQGLGAQALQLDPEYRAQVSITGVVSSEDRDFINGNFVVSPTGTLTGTFTSGIFSSAPNCQATATSDVDFNLIISSVSSTTVVIKGDLAQTAATARDTAFSLSCKKSGNDYLASSAAVYSQASANYSRTAYTPTFTNLGTPTSVSCYHSREGEYLNIDCSFVMPGSGSLAAEARISLPNGLTSSVASIRSVGEMSEAYSSAGYFGMSMLAESGVGYLTIGRQTSALNAATKVNGDQLVASALHVFHARVPITGWSNAATIVGSFTGVPAVPGASTVQDIYTTVTGGGTNGSCTSTCTPVNMKGFSTPTRNSAGNYTNTFSTAFTVAPICHVSTSALNASSAIGCCRVSTTTTAATVVCNMCTTGGAEDVAYHLRCVGDK